jgi:hypothetical protein
LPSRARWRRCGSEQFPQAQVAIAGGGQVADSKPSWSYLVRVDTVGTANSKSSSNRSLYPGHNRWAGSDLPGPQYLADIRVAEQLDRIALLSAPGKSACVAVCRTPPAGHAAFTTMYRSGGTVIAPVGLPGSVNVVTSRPANRPETGNYIRSFFAFSAGTLPVDRLYR